MAGVIGGATALTKQGAGTLTLSGANTYTGLTTISAGTMMLGSTAALGTAAAGTSVTAGATLDLNGFTLATVEPLTLNGTGVGGTAGALTNSSATAATYSGAITLGSASSIVASSGKTLSCTGAINGAYALDVFGGGTVTLGGSIGNSALLTSFSGAAGTTLIINGGLVSTTGAQTYNGTTIFGAATTLTAGSISAPGAVTATAGTLTLKTGTGSATLTNTVNDFGTIAVGSGSNISLIDANALTIAGINATGLVDMRTQTGDLTLTTAAIATTSASAVTLVADVTSTPDATGSGGNVKNTGNVAITTGSGGAWRIYTGNPTGTNRGGLTEAGKCYNVDDGSDPLASGNRVYFRIQPTVIITTGNASKVYNGTGGADPAFAYSLGGLVDGDSTISTAPTLTRVAGKNVGTYAIGAAGAASDVGYAIGYANTGLLTITAASLAVTGVTAANKVYDTTTAATLGGTAAIAALAGDTVNLGGTGSGVFADKTVGTGKTVTVSGISLGGADAGNYTYNTTAATTASITKRNLAVTGVTANTKVYDGTTAATLGGTATVTPLGTDVVIVGGAGVGVFANKNAGTGKAVTNVSGYSITGGADAGNYTLVQPTGLTADITKRALTLSGTPVAASRVYDGTTADSIGGATLSGVLAGDTVTLGGLFADKNAGTGKTVSLALSGASAGNYSIAPVTGLTASITAKALTMTGTPVAASRVYNGTLTTTVSGATLSGFVTGDSTSSVILGGLFADKNVGTGKAVSLALSGASGGNYSIAPVTGLTASITARALAIIAANKTKLFGGVNPALTYAVGGLGLAAGDTPSTVFTGALAATAGVSSPIGSYAITQGTLTSNTNYIISSFVNGVLTVQ